jgi:hypothetical protein
LSPMIRLFARSKTDMASCPANNYENNRRQQW